MIDLGFGIDDTMLILVLTSRINEPNNYFSFVYFSFSDIYFKFSSEDLESYLYVLGLEVMYSGQKKK